MFMYNRLVSLNVFLIFFLVSMVSSSAFAQRFYTTQITYYGKVGEYPVEMNIVEVLGMTKASYSGSYQYLKVGQKIELNFHTNTDVVLIEEPEYDIEEGRVKVKEFIGNKHTGTFYFDKQYFDGQVENQKILRGYWHSPDEKRILKFELNFVKSVIINPGVMGR